MKPSRIKLITLAVPALLVLLLLGLYLTAPQHPTAMVRVVDFAGNPIAGATIRPEGMRTKAGPYRSGWYGWRTGNNAVGNAPVVTDSAGRAFVPYPKYVFERIETGVLCLGVSHPDYVAKRPECEVATAPPAGAPWRTVIMDLWDRIRHKQLLTEPAPIVLTLGARLQVVATNVTDFPAEAQLFAQVSQQVGEDTWLRPEPGVIETRRLAAGSHEVRVVLLGTNGEVWFSPVQAITVVSGVTNRLEVGLSRGATLSGKLDKTVPRPVQNGRVVAHVWPVGLKPENSPPQWHAWAKVEANGSFVIKSLPPGDLEVVALCDGFIGTNGPGQFQMRYPQKHAFGSNDLAITIGMEPTAWLEVTVMDDQGRPLKDVRVMTWPNVRYGEWGANIIMSDCYNTADAWRAKPNLEYFRRLAMSMDFQGVSDASGLAVLSNLPPEVQQLAVEHPVFTLPISQLPDGRKHREASFTLVVGRTNRLTLRLERKEESEITHY